MLKSGAIVYRLELDKTGKPWYIFSKQITYNCHRVVMRQHPGAHH